MKKLYIAVLYKLGDEKILTGENIDALISDCEDSLAEGEFEHYAISKALDVLISK